MRDGIVNEDWHVIHGGDGFYPAFDNVEPWIVYPESQDGYIDRRDMRTGQQRSIRPEAKTGEPHYRFQWNSPVAAFPPPKTLDLLSLTLPLTNRHRAATP